jgi:hypothetical protein
MRLALIVPILLAFACVAEARAAAPNAVIRGTLAAFESEGLVQTDDVDETKTWSEQIASQKSDGDATLTVYLVEFHLRNGKTIRAIANWTKSQTPERSGLVIYLVSQILQPDGKPTPSHHK